MQIKKRESSTATPPCRHQVISVSSFQTLVLILLRRCDLNNQPQVAGKPCIKTQWQGNLIWGDSRNARVWNKRMMGNLKVMMTSSNGNIFRVTSPLCGEFTGPGEFPTQRPVTRSFDVFFDLRVNKRLNKNREAGDLRRHRGHYDVNVMCCDRFKCRSHIFMSIFFLGLSLNHQS